MSRQSASARRAMYAADDADRKRRAEMTIEEDGGRRQRYLAAQIAEVDRVAKAVDGGKDWELPEGADLATLARVRASALSALWRLPITLEEHAAYPAYLSDGPTVGSRLLSHVARFQGAIVWRDDHNPRAVFTATTRIPYRRRAREARGFGAPDPSGPSAKDRGYEYPPESNGYERYTYTVEELGSRARRAAHLAREWRLVE